LLGLVPVTAAIVVPAQPATAAIVVRAQPAAAGSAALVPSFTCAAPNGDNTFTYFFGYTISGTSPVTVPIGPDNQFTGGTKDLGQPAVFSPGSHPNSFAVTTAATNLAWHLDGTHLTANSSLVCNSVPVVSEAPAGVVLALASGMPLAVWFVVKRHRGRSGPRHRRRSSPRHRVRSDPRPTS
jgi:hypothetical protein